MGRSSKCQAHGGKNNLNAHVTTTAPRSCTKRPERYANAPWTIRLLSKSGNTQTTQPRHTQSTDQQHRCTTTTNEKRKACHPTNHRQSDTGARPIGTGSTPPELGETYAQNEPIRTSRSMSRPTHRTKRSAEHRVCAPAPTRDQQTGSTTRRRMETRSPTRDQPHPHK